eukprot:TRINITY_DN36500_c0_g1_i2.p1 TRINITY_DN36500_c0_g1~~TRINITY_DN36500_c0_g1_i2.p1  ORF type:complete len:499 (-),score=106.12 TRINITY_DN36500_c0_g1_i2:79-1575(-)
MQSGSGRCRAALLASFLLGAVCSRTVEAAGKRQVLRVRIVAADLQLSQSASSNAPSDPQGNEESDELAAPPGQTNATVLRAAVLDGPVFYGRPVLRVPREALLGPETVGDVGTRDELVALLAGDVCLTEDSSSACDVETLGLALAVAIEARDPKSVFRDWLDAVADLKLPPALTLSERQQEALLGTTVQDVPRKLAALADMVKRTSSRLAVFRQRPLEPAQAAWALAVVLLHGRPELPEGALRNFFGQDDDYRVRLVALLPVLHMRAHPDPKVAAPFHEGRMLSEDNRSTSVLMQTARSDMANRSEVFAWPGRFSNSELAMRLGVNFTYGRSNPTGIGGNVSIPSNWNPRRGTPNYKTFQKYNCTSPDAFELRFSEKGWPARIFVRCSRVAFMLANSFYNPETEQRLDMLDKWPPPSKYSHNDWLAWTRADSSTAKIIADYCQDMRRQLRDGITSTLVEDFRHSWDPVDKLIWRIRQAESRTFKECIALSKTIAGAMD